MNLSTEGNNMSITTQAKRLRNNLKIAVNGSQKISVRTEKYSSGEFGRAVSFIKPLTVDQLAVFLDLDSYINYRGNKVQCSTIKKYSENGPSEFWVVRG